MDGKITHTPHLGPKIFCQKLAGKLDQLVSLSANFHQATIHNHNQWLNNALDA